jgi:hypothetical protein
LRTLDDVRIFMLDNLPEDDQARRSWQKACEILLAAADGLADVSAAKSNLRYFSKPSRWRNDRGARLDFLRSRWAQRCEIVKACKDRGIGIFYLLPLIWF